MSKIKGIDVIRAFRPENAGSGEPVLEYVELPKAVKLYAVDASRRRARAESTEPGSLEEAAAVRQLALHDLVRDAEKGLQATGEESKEVWANRFTLASTALYGAPDKAEMQRLVNNQYKQLVSYKNNEAISQDHLAALLAVYEPLVAGLISVAVERASLKTERGTLAAYGDVIMKRYGQLFELVDQDDYTSRELADLFDRALAWLAKHDDLAWSHWKTIQQDGTSLRVMNTKKAIIIAKQRTNADKASAKGLLAHELLGHVLRSKNGYQTSDPRLAIGLVGSAENEEGLCIVTEAAHTGLLPLKLVNRYIDIGLALGTLDGRQMSRPELFKICYARQLISQQNEGPTELDLAGLEKSVWGYVDRIYRGGRGDDSTHAQAVFTKDIAYYQGYRTMVDYIGQELKTGSSASAIFDYLSRGVFDPTDAQHVALVESLA